MNSLSPTSELEQLKLIDSLADSFEAQWRQNRRPRIEEILSSVPASIRSQLALELIAIELEIRSHREETLILEEYIRRFPGLSDAVRSAFSLFDQSDIAQQTHDLEVVHKSDPEAWDNLPRGFGRYRLEEPLGQGGFGSVFRATDLQLGRVVAIKLPHPGASPTAKRRFLAEARAAAKLNHPGIVSVYESGEQEGTLFIASELIDGDELGIARKKRQPSLKQMIRWIRDAARALHHANQQGVVHRDVKPGNILISIDNRVVISDFGLARRFDDPSSLTIEGQPFGTPAYMSPEQASGKFSLVDASSDQYSLGAVLYEFLTGRLPYRGTIPEILNQVMAPTCDPPAPRSVHTKVPRDLEAICLKSLTHEQHARYVTLDAFADDLDRWLRNEPIHARPVTRLQRTWKKIKRHPLIASLIGLVCLLSIMGVALAVAAWNQESRAEIAESTVNETEGQLTERSQELQQSQQNLTRVSGTLEQTATESERREYARLIRQISGAISSRGTPPEIIQDLLDRCPEHLRGWEWDFYQRQLLELPRLLSQIRDGDDSRWFSATLAADGSQVYLIDQRGVVSSLSPVNGKTQPGWASGATRAPNVAVSNNGLIAVGSPSEGIVIRDRDFTRGEAPRFLGNGQENGRSMRLGNDDFLYGSPTARLEFETPEFEKQIVDYLEKVDQKRTGSSKLYDKETGSTRYRSAKDAVEFFKHLNPEALTRRGPTAILYETITLPRLSNVGWVVEFDKTSSFLAVGGDRFVQIWNLKEKERTRLLLAHLESTVRFLEFSPDNKLITAGMNNGELVVWNWEDGNELYRNNFVDPLIGIVWSSDSRSIIAPLGDGKLGTISLETGTVIEANENHTGKITAISINSNKTQVATAGEDREIRIWDFPGLKTNAVLSAGEQPVIALGFLAERSQLLVADAQTVEIRTVPQPHDPETDWIDSKVIEARFDKKDSITHFSISPDSKQIAMLLHETTWTKEPFRVRSLLTGELVHAENPVLPADPAVGRFFPERVTGNETAFDPHGRRLLMSAGDRIRAWSLPDWKELVQKAVPPQQEQADRPKAGFGKLPAGANFANPDGLLNPKGFAPNAQKPQPLDHVSGRYGHLLAITSLGDRMAVNTPQGVLMLQGDSFQPLILCSLAELHQGRAELRHIEVTAIQFSPDGRFVAVGTDKGRVGIFDSANGTLIHIIDLPSPAQATREVFDLAFHPTNNQLAVASDDSIVSLWDVETGQSVGQLVGHGDEVRSIAFHHEGTRFVSASHDGTIRLWNLHDHTELAILLETPEGLRLSQLEFTPDGRTLVVVESGHLRLLIADRKMEQ